MKKQNLAVTFIALLFAGVTFGQSFQKTLFNEKYDFNHYSIASIEKGYVCVGTLFGEDNNDIHVVKLDNNGTILWERVIDESKDDRGLDVVIDERNNIVLTGYISHRGVGSANLYVAKMNENGVYLNDRVVQHFPANYWEEEYMTAGTNIIYDEKNEVYIVGGMTSESRMVSPIHKNHALLFKFDRNLNLISDNLIFTGGNFQSINDIEIVPEGYFITGGVKGIGAKQVVLAAIVDNDLDLIKNFSFDDLNGGKNVGVSMVYEKDEDNIYILSNNSSLPLIHYDNFNYLQITKFSEISKDLDWCEDVEGTSYILDLPFPERSASFMPVGFQLEECTWNNKHLIASGLFAKRENDNSEDAGALAWIIEFDKATGNRVGGMEWSISSATDFSLHGDQLFSTYGGSISAPLYYNQEMLTKRNDGKGYVLIAPRLIERKYGIDLLTTYNMEPMGCFNEFKFQAQRIEIENHCIDQTDRDFYARTPKIPVLKHKNERTVFCRDLNRRYGARSLAIEENKENTALHVFPNPGNGSITIDLPEGITTGTISIIDLTGKRLLQHTISTNNNQLDVSQLSNGIYHIQLTTQNGVLFKQKFVKTN